RAAVGRVRRRRGRRPRGAFVYAGPAGDGVRIAAPRRVGGAVGVSWRRSLSRHGRPRVDGDPRRRPAAAPAGRVDQVADRAGPVAGGRGVAVIPVAEGVSLNVVERPGSESAVPFVLVHGLASNARMWDGVGARLAELGHPSTALDQRGHGQSDKPDTGYDFTTITDDLATVIKSLGYDRPVIAGQSRGG